MQPTGGVLLLLLGAWSLGVGACTVLHSAAGGSLLADGLIALSGLLCLVAAVFYFANRCRWFALLAPLVAMAAEGLSFAWLGSSWLGLAKIVLLGVALLLGLGIGRARPVANTNHLPGVA